MMILSAMNWPDAFSLVGFLVVFGVVACFAMWIGSRQP